MLAKRLPTIMPTLSLDEAMETTKIHSVAGKIEKENSLITKVPRWHGFVIRAIYECLKSKLNHYF